MEGKYNIYVGARYIPIFDGTWDNTKAYEPLTIVEYQGNSYTSKTFVPEGADITDEKYWALSGNYNAQIEQYRQEVLALSNTVSGFGGRIDDVETKYVGLSGQVLTNKLNIENNTQNIANNLTALTLVSEQLTKTDDQLQSIDINVLFPPDGLEPLLRNNSFDNTSRLQAIIDYLKRGNYDSKIYFPVGNYRFKDTVNIDKNHIYLYGEERAGTRLILDNNTGSLFYVGTPDNSRLVNFVKFENFFFNTTQTAIAGHNYITFQNCSYCEIVNCSMYGGKEYVKLNTAQGTKMYDVQMNNETAIDGVIGVEIIGQCVSSRFQRVTMNFVLNTNCTGFLCNTWAQDLYFERTETTGCNVVFNISNTTANSPGDIIIKNSILDNVKGYAVLMQNMVGAYPNTNIIDGMYLVPNANSTQLIRMNTVNNVMISNIGVANINNNNGNDVFSLVNCNRINISSCNIIDADRGIVATNSDSITCNNNIVSAINRDCVCSYLINGSSHCICNANVFKGRFPTLVSADAGSSYTALTNNLFNSSAGFTGSVTFNATNSINENNIIHREV